ncbi:MAG: hypothetical protein OXC18_03460 [Desulfurellaceae bacterium]|nr:hypothetical protein [Desulfurellaceae bacterium]
MIEPNRPDDTNTPASDRRPGYGYRPVDLIAPPAVIISCARGYSLGLAPGGIVGNLAWRRPEHPGPTTF